MDAFLEIKRREKLELSDRFAAVAASLLDTQLRRGESYGEKWQYVLEDPVRAGLVKHSRDWPYRGELNTLMW
jgi:hypothetical protein